MRLIRKAPQTSFRADIITIADFLGQKAAASRARWLHIWLAQLGCTEKYYMFTIFSIDVIVVGHERNAYIRRHRGDEGHKAGRAARNAHARHARRGKQGCVLCPGDAKAT